MDYSDLLNRTSPARNLLLTEDLPKGSIPSYHHVLDRTRALMIDEKGENVVGIEAQQYLVPLFKIATQEESFAAAEAHRKRETELLCALFDAAAVETGKTSTASGIPAAEDLDEIVGKSEVSAVLASPDDVSFPFAGKHGHVTLSNGAELWWAEGVPSGRCYITEATPDLTGRMPIRTKFYTIRSGDSGCVLGMTVIPEVVRRVSF